ncbi:MAG: hypothetical protein JWN10_493 [Solirubrobacterales bacterium]|nr:hypothetical protein [Solirubrobacterales bacterium]
MQAGAPSQRFVDRADGHRLLRIAPVVEEIFFRGLLYRALRNRLAVIPAAAIDGVIFGLGHMQYPLLVRPDTRRQGNLPMPK